MNMERLLKPKSIAVVGASEKDGFGGDTCRNILRYTKNLDNVYFVNPKRETVFDRKCYPSLSDIPCDIDLVIICTPKKIVNSIIEEAGRKKCGGAVVFASGYAETGMQGRQDQEELVKLCADSGIAMMGPNCAGFANYVGDVFSFAFMSEVRERKGNIGMISQSGQICLSALDKIGMEFSYIISSGNSAHITTEEYLEFLAEDKDTKVITAYIEGVKKPQVFCRALQKAAARKKPVILLKTGKSAKSAELASSHTGSIAGSDAVFDAVVKKYGAIRAEDMQELLGTALMFSHLPSLPEKGKKWACMNVSGGEAGISADIAYIKGVELADFSAATRSALKEIVPDYCTPNNPLDLTATLAYVPESFSKALDIVAHDENVGGIVIAYTFTNHIIDQSIPCMIEGLKLYKQHAGKTPVVWMPFIEHTPNYECAKNLYALEIPIISSGLSGMRSLKILNDFTAFDHESASKATLAFPDGIQGKARKALSELESREYLFKANIPGIYPAVNAKDEESAVKASEEIGCPVAVKINSPDILHKSDIGGVKINLQNKEQVREAFREIMHNAKTRCPNADIHGVTVSKMLDAGLELMVGMKNDSQYGPMIMAALGGIFVELFKDTALCPVPVSKDEAVQMIMSLKSFPLLNGYRGSKILDVEKTAELICALSAFCEEHKNDIAEIDLNPVFVYEKGKGVAAADALVITYE